MVSILNSVKLMSGISPDIYEFHEVVFHINSVFGILTQLGIGPKEGFSIQDSLQTWDEFLEVSDHNSGIVKSYMYAKVRLLFDPPQNSFLVKALEDQITEFEWRLEFNGSLTNNP